MTRLILISAVLFFAACQPEVAPTQPIAIATDFDSLMREARPRAVEQVLLSARNESPFVCVNALEASLYMPDRATPLAQAGLYSTSPAVRFAAATVIGRLKLKDLAPLLRERLVLERKLAEQLAVKIKEQGDKGGREMNLAQIEATISQSRAATAAALFALKRCGEDVDLSPLADMLAAPDALLRGNIAMLMGYLNDSSAVPLLRDRASLPLPRASAESVSLLRLQLAEAMVRLGDSTALGAIRAGVYARYPEVRVLAVSMVGELDDRTQSPGLMKILGDKDTESMELRLAAATALARFGNYAGEPLLFDCASSSEQLLRAGAARGLVLCRDAESAKILITLLSDSQEQVRLTAAVAILSASR